MTEQLFNYINDPRNAEYNFELALWYDDAGHLAAASGFYLRAAVCAYDDLLSYESLLRLANCFSKLGGRTYMCKGILLRAISLDPLRPEAYFLLSRLYEEDKNWQESYTFAVMGQRLRGEVSRLRTNVDYPGNYGLIFEQAVSAWWIGLYDESLYLLRGLKKNPDMLPIHITAVNINLARLEGTVSHDSLIYYNEMYERLRVKFTGSQGIKQNYSQLCQDLFVLTMLDGKRNGTFLEIGCGDPLFGSNTKLLEEFEWTGVSIDIEQRHGGEFAKQRTCSFIAADATQMDFDTLVSHDFDYLQIDIEPPLNSLCVLLRIPFYKHRFGVITFEHDAYRSTGVRERSRNYLRSLGYVLVVGDIAINRYDSCEDWWVHPSLVDPELLKRMLDRTEGTKKADQYMYSTNTVNDIQLALVRRA